MGDGRRVSGLREALRALSEWSQAHRSELEPAEARALVELHTLLAERVEKAHAVEMRAEGFRPAGRNLFVSGDVPAGLAEVLDALLEDPSGKRGKA